MCVGISTLKMTVVDTISMWYAQNVLIPKMEEINHPGFIITNLSEANSEISLRELALPEEVFSQLEKRIIEKFGEEGRKVLYSIGKKFGYYYASLSRLKQITNAKNEKEFDEFVKYFVMYVSCIFASGASSRIELKEKKFEVDFNDYIICRKNGQGYILTIGGSAGVWSYMLDDKSLEGAQTLCTGRGDKVCQIIVAPTEYLDRRNIKYYNETNLIATDFSTAYQEMNLVRNAEYSKNSLEELIDNGFVSYEKGVLKCLDERYFICEASLLHFLEVELQKIEGGLDILSEVSVNYGRQLAEKSKHGYNYEDFIPNFLAALGYGDVLMSNDEGKIKIFISYFPWSEISVEHQYTMLRGMITGMISGFIKKEVKINFKESSQINGFLGVIFSE